jgi:hypothetical protein
VLRPSAKWVIGLFLLGSSLSAQVRVVIPKRYYHPKEQIPAKLENHTSQPITVCVEFGQHSPNGHTTESTPIPFFVERRDNGKWTVMLIGPDVGSKLAPLELGSGKSMPFPFRLNDEGTMRLRLDYWIGSRPDVKCTSPTKGANHYRSAIFVLG